MGKADFIPVCEPLLGGNELKYVTDAVRTGWISSSGRYVTEFERAFAEYLGVEHAVTTTSGTTALHLACLAAGIGEGDEVVIPTFTMIASAYAVTYCGAKPVFVDCEPDTWNIDMEKVAAAITPRTKAIMPVHIYGHPCDMGPLMELAARNNLMVIEDAAEAIGSRYRDLPCGAIGQIGCFSFFANKTITCGEGGMVVTNLPEVVERVRYFKNMCFPRDSPRDYRHRDIGFNYRMPNTVAAIGLAQMERVQEYVAMRRKNATLYTTHLSQLEGVVLPIERPWARNSYWMYGILIEPSFGLERDAVMAGLREQGVDSRPFFQPMHVQESLRRYVVTGSMKYPVAEDIANRGLYLPSGSGLKPEQIEHVCRSLACLKPTA